MTFDMVNLLLFSIRKPSLFSFSHPAVRTGHHSGINTTPFERYRDSCAQVRQPKSREWLDECFFNRIMRKVNKDSTVSIDKVSYDVPMQFISMKVEIRFLPDDMSSAYILYDGVHYPIRRTDRNENCRTKRDNPPYIDYAKLKGDDPK